MCVREREKRKEREEREKREKTENYLLTHDQLEIGQPVGSVELEGFPSSIYTYRVTIYIEESKYSLSSAPLGHIGS